MIPYVDCHTHQFYEPSDSVISMRNCIVSTDYFQNQLCSVGIHPWYIDQDYENQLSTLRKYAAKENVLAIGECGLDKLSSAPWEKQAKAFQDQIDLANALSKPLILHTVRAYQETVEQLQNQKLISRVVFHGFNKHAQLGYSLVEKGYFLNLGADMLKGNLTELIHDIPLTSLFLETDDKNISIQEIYTYFCAVRKINVETLKQQLYTNFCTVFKYSK
ncbi:TatD family hydrolase [Sphingobacterium hungaricum]|uniref:TatD DNase family protein n=1 Tax=Sphingobacterium hungaricum TaxID=2082723 RepID=A0A928UXS6_9SPHI|nr:TatD family hydrolase [Sphingobacterium hungaricum]MBE8715195.1 hypothetical protein [Sphingobacterium hungaricum]